MVTKTLSFDERHMRRALRAAERAYKRGEIPIGAVVVDSYGHILATASNAVEKKQCQVEHAEVRAIYRATKKIKSWRLEGCTIYITLEPCVMCYGLIGLSRIERVVYGAKSPLFGALVGTSHKTAAEPVLDNGGMPPLYTKHIKSVTGGVLADVSTTLLKQFFSAQRRGRE